MQLVLLVWTTQLPVHLAPMELSWSIRNVKTVVTIVLRVSILQLNVFPATNVKA